MLQEEALPISEKLAITGFSASNGWLDIIIIIKFLNGSQHKED